MKQNKMDNKIIMPTGTKGNENVIPAKAGIQMPSSKKYEKPGFRIKCGMTTKGIFR